MKEMMQNRLKAKRESLKQMQIIFRINMKDMEYSTYEDNAINALLDMRKLKTEIAELEFCLKLCQEDN